MSCTPSALPGPSRGPGAYAGPSWRGRGRPLSSSGGQSPRAEYLPPPRAFSLPYAHRSSHNTSPDGYSTPIAVRYTQDDLWRSGWLRPVDAKAEPHRPPTYMHVGFHLGKGVIKKSQVALPAIHQHGVAIVHAADDELVQV